MILRKNLPMGVDALIEVVRQRGLRLANLFQLGDGRWQANVSNDTSHWDFGRGDTAEEALMAALHLAATSSPERYLPDKPVRSVSPVYTGAKPGGYVSRPSVKI